MGSALTALGTPHSTARDPAVFESRVLIGQRVGSNFHSIPRELILSRTSVSRGNNSNCFRGKQFWPSLTFISITGSKSVRRVARVTTRFKEPRGALVAPLLRSVRYSPGPLGSLKRVSYLCSVSMLYLEPAALESNVLIGKRAGYIFHSIPREFIVSGKP